MVGHRPVDSTRRAPSLKGAPPRPRHIESALIRPIKVKDRSTTIRHTSFILDQEIIQRIASAAFHRARVAPERRAKGYPLLHAKPGPPIVRLRPIGGDDQMEMRYSSLWKQHWAPVGRFRRTVPSLVKAPPISASEPMWAGFRIRRAKLRSAAFWTQNFAIAISGVSGVAPGHQRPGHQRMHRSREAALTSSWGT